MGEPTVTTTAHYPFQRLAECFNSVSNVLARSAVVHLTSLRVDCPRVSPLQQTANRVICFESNCQCVHYFRVFGQKYYDCQCLGFSTCAHILIGAFAHGGCQYTVRESAPKTDWNENPRPHRGIEPASVYCLAFRSVVLPT